MNKALAKKKRLRVMLKGEGRLQSVKSSRTLKSTLRTNINFFLMTRTQKIDKLVTLEKWIRDS